MHTRVTQLLAAAMYMVRGAVISSAAAFGTIPLAFYAGTNGVTAKTDGVVLAMAAGMKKGELSGYSANLRALVGGIAPLIYAQLYARGGAGKVYYAAAMAMFVATILHTKVVDEVKMLERQKKAAAAPVAPK
jgi:hypothetical protein